MHHSSTRNHGRNQRHHRNGERHCLSSVPQNGLPPIASSRFMSLHPLPNGATEVGDLRQRGRWKEVRSLPSGLSRILQRRPDLVSHFLRLGNRRGADAAIEWATRHVAKQFARMRWWPRRWGCRVLRTVRRHRRTLPRGRTLRRRTAARAGPADSDGPPTTPGSVALADSRHELTNRSSHRAACSAVQRPGWASVRPRRQADGGVKHGAGV